MSKWTNSHGSESGILRKSELKEKKEELFVFGYTCKLFRDDEKAKHIDQGKHLIPWMGDDTLKIDRYDARGALHDLSRLEPPSGGYDWRIELTRTELDVEQLCDEERYRAMHTNEDEEEMYREEELKRLHAAGYGQVGFTYEAAPSETPPPPVEVDDPFEPTVEYQALFPDDIVMPETLKLNAIIEKTAKFIASQGVQMEILLRAKQADNPQFQFLNRDTELNKYYMHLINLCKTGKWPPKEHEDVVEEKPQDEEYLHPSLGTTIIESAPSIPSIHYKPSADCDYTMLISKMKGDMEGTEVGYDEPPVPGEVPPPGTELTRLPPQPHIARGPVLYRKGPDIPMNDYFVKNVAQAQLAMKTIEPIVTSNVAITPSKSTGLSLMKNYNTDSDSDTDSDSSSSAEAKCPPILKPSVEIQTVIDKMAAYVARNGDEFADIVRAKNDPRFTFLEPGHMYYPYYKSLMLEKRGGTANNNCNGEKSMVPVSFSIKKQKEPDPVLPKPALPYESSSEDETDNKTEEKVENTAHVPTPIPPVIMYRIEAQDKPANFYTLKELVKEPQIEVVKDKVTSEKEMPIESSPVVKKKREETEKVHKKDKKKQKSRKRERSRSRSRSREKKKKKSKESVIPENRRKEKKVEVVDEIISIEEAEEEFIDLTDDVVEVKDECDAELEKLKQIERRKRAAEFLKKVGVDPSAAMPTTSLASAMVDTLESIKKKKEVEARKEVEERKKRKEKRKRKEERRDRSGSEDEESHRKTKRRHKSKDRKHNDEEYQRSKRKRRKKEKKSSKATQEVKPLDIDLINTLKELRSSSPTRALTLEVDVSSAHQTGTSSEEGEIDRKNKKKKKEREREREYSEGEVSSESRSTEESE